MKKLISFILAAMLTLSVAVLFSGCGETTVNVESITGVDGNFAGTRVFNISLPGTIGASKALDIMSESMPDMGKNSGCIKIAKAENSDNSNQLQITLEFSSREDYENKVSSIINQSAKVNLAQPDNILVKGTRYTEDFDSSQLLDWVKNVFESNFDVSNVKYNFVSNVFDLNGTLFTTDTRANINEVEGYGINKIKVSTTNTKNDLYDREFIFEIPEEVMESLGDDVRVFFESNTNELARYSDWSNKGSYEEYQVKFKELTIDELQYVTNQIMNVADGTVKYGDFTNSSTPLSEGLIFEENINTMCFMTADKAYVPVEYNYSVPTNTTYGEGSVLENGGWINAGKWTDYTYSLDFDGGDRIIHIPDGIQYKISGIDFYLNNKGGNSFKRTVDILYSKESKDGVSYAYNFFKSKGALVSTDESTDNYICRVETEGTALEISKAANELFGGGNYLDYKLYQSAFDISDNTEFVDYINLGYMLTSENAEKPMTYTVTKSGKENINRLKLISDSNKKQLDRADENGAFKVEFSGGNARISYNGTIADWGKATAFIVVSCVLALLSGALIVFFIRKSLKTKNITVQTAPQQTTTFLLKDLNRKKNSEEDE